MFRGDVFTCAWRGGGDGGRTSLHAWVAVGGETLRGMSLHTPVGWGVSYGVGAGWMGEMAIFARDK